MRTPRPVTSGQVLDLELVWTLPDDSGLLHWEKSNYSVGKRRGRERKDALSSKEKLKRLGEIAGRNPVNKVKRM